MNERRSRWALLLGGLLLCGAAGCAADLPTEVIKLTLREADDTVGKLDEVTRYVKEAVTASKPDKTITATDEHLRKALAAAEGLRSLGERLQARKRDADWVREKISPEARAELATRYRGEVESRLAGLEKSQNDLRLALEEAEARADNAGGKDLLRQVREKIKAGRDAFEVLTKQH